MGLLISWATMETKSDLIWSIFFKAVMSWMTVTVPRFRWSLSLKGTHRTVRTVSLFSARAPLLELLRQFGELLRRHGERLIDHLEQSFVLDQIP